MMTKKSFTANSSVIKVAVTDDHPIFLNTLAAIIDSLPGYRVIIKACDGKDLLDKLAVNMSPDIILLDISMPRMDGAETITILKKKLPLSKIMAVSGYCNGIDVLMMYKLGADGFVSKNTDNCGILAALTGLRANGRYFPGYEHLQQKKTGEDVTDGQLYNLSEKEMIFLKLACTGLGYKEIARKMNVSRFTINDYRKGLFQKFEVHTRQALVLVALKYKLMDPASILQQEG